MADFFCSLSNPMKIRITLPALLAFLSLYFLACLSLPAQYAFEKIYGDGFTDEMFWVCTTPGGDYAMTGYQSFGSTIVQSNMVVSLLGPDGTPKWTTGIPGNGLDFGCSVKPCRQNGLIVTGYTSSYGLNGDPDMMLCRLDSSGQLEWTRTFGGNSFDVGEAVIETRDGHFVAVGSGNPPGSPNRDILLVKTDSTGTPVWEQYLGQNGEELGQSVIELPDSSYLVTGRTASFSGQEFLLIKVSPAGAVEWAKTYDLGVFQLGNSVILAPDSGFVMCGSVNGNYCLIKTNASGDVEWAKTYNHTFQDEGRSVVLADSGGYVFSGFSYTNAQDLDVVKVDVQGNVRWAHTLLGKSNAELGVRMIREPRGGYLVVGARSGPNSLGSTDGLLIRLDEGGFTACADTSFQPTVVRDTPTVTVRALLATARNSMVSHSIVPVPVTMRDSSLCDSCYHRPQISLTDTTPCVGDTVVWSHLGNRSVIDSYRWSKLGSLVSTNPEVTEVYSNSSPVSFELVVEGGGCADSTTLTLQVLSAPNVDFSYLINQLNVDVQDLSTSPNGGITDWNWDLGDGNTAGNASFSHLYSSTGTYTICLEVTDVEGCRADTCKELMVAVSLDPGETPAGLQVYPNPAGPDLFLSLDRFSPDLRLFLVNGEGKRFEPETNWSTGSEKMRVNLRGIPAGSYLLILQDQHTRNSRKVILSGN